MLRTRISTKKAKQVILDSNVKVRESSFCYVTLCLVLVHLCSTKKAKDLAWIKKSRSQWPKFETQHFALSLCIYVPNVMQVSPLI